MHFVWGREGTHGGEELKNGRVVHPGFYPRSRHVACALWPRERSPRRVRYSLGTTDNARSLSCRYEKTRKRESWSREMVVERGKKEKKKKKKRENNWADGVTLVSLKNILRGS